MRFGRKRPPQRRPQAGEKAPGFQLPSVQGGQLRLDMRTAHGPVALVFVSASEKGRELLAQLKEKEEEFRQAGAYNYSYPNPEIRTGKVPSTRAGTTVAAVVRSPAMEPVRELQREFKLPFYVLWDQAGRVCSEYGVREGEIAAALVETDSSLAWFSEPGESPQAERILQASHPAQSRSPSPAPPASPAGA